MREVNLDDGAGQATGAADLWSLREQLAERLAEVHRLRSELNRALEANAVLGQRAADVDRLNVDRARYKSALVRIVNTSALWGLNKQAQTLREIARAAIQGRDEPAELAS